MAPWPHGRGIVLIGMCWEMAPGRFQKKLEVGWTLSASGAKVTPKLARSCLKVSLKSSQSDLRETADDHWSLVIMNDHEWSWMIMSDHEWSSVVMNDHEWSWMVMNDHDAWSWMPINDHQWSLRSHTRDLFFNSKTFSSWNNKTFSSWNNNALSIWNNKACSFWNNKTSCVAGRVIPTTFALVRTKLY